MAGTSLLALIDDIASVLDDVAVMTKLATKKTAGVLGDDLALNAEQVAGVDPDRELPVVWAVAKGSAINKTILVPAALAISALLPWLIMPLLMIGGAYLCFEGFEKVFHKLFHDDDAEVDDELAHLDPVEFEKAKIKGAIRTDFILSAEIIVIALGVVAEASFGQQVAVLVAIAVGITLGVYGLVAGIVKLDDAGLWLSEREPTWQQKLGHAIIWVAPLLMKTLGIVGTAAMFLVGGSIILHGIGPLYELVADFGFLLSTLVEGVTGVVTGGLVVAVVTGVKKLRGASA